MSKKIYISPSDQTANTYASGNTTEAIQCRAIAKLLVEDLKRCGFQSKTNVTDSMYARVAESNNWGADLHVCIHTNAYNGNVAGTRLFCYKIGSQGHDVCKKVMETLAPITPGNSDGITARPELYETRATNSPCCYIEVEFHDNPTVAAWIITHKQETSEAIAKGICNYYGVKYIENKSSDISTDAILNGEKFYKTLGSVTDKYYRPTLDKLVEKDILRGQGGTGDNMIINLYENDIRILVMLDRAGSFDK